ncbi:hypothetical protein [Terrisporobacter hibernicus]|uniref:Uncharacterized protein n=1 Tax=Terrisporobacter hibernicus TaxID=2813371 RepID=A0AAX2ZGC9_9FIRM|nr:hypothetical protein [Terrisporobacter hibernicus]UEL48287.1 hypothetical protein JW646_02205 [Terrisporobacter hibernicus]
MYIKLKIEDELLKALETDAEEYVRTCTQQAMYIIKSHYKNKNNKNLIIQESSSNLNIDTDMKKEKLFKDEIEKEFLEVSNIEKEELESNISSDEFIGEEIYNF